MLKLGSLTVLLSLIGAVSVRAAWSYEGEVAASAAGNACNALAEPAVARDLPVDKVAIVTAAVVDTAEGVPAHCLVDGEINRRIGIDRQSYAIRFRLRLPGEGWNGRLYMGGGGGTNGRLTDPADRLRGGFATLGTDGGHDNTVNNVDSSGGPASFGVDPQARIDFGYNAYDKVTQVGKKLIEIYYGRAPTYSYFSGCSEGGREGMLLSQRFPDHYDGIIVGDPAFHLPLSVISGVYTTQLFAGLADRGGHRLANGEPALAKTYSNPDLMLVRGAVLSACDKLDGLTDEVIDDRRNCTSAVVEPELEKLVCDADKSDTCLTADQVRTLRTAFAGPRDSKGTQLYSDWPWDSGISGRDGDSYYNGWRAWWLGDPDSSSNSAIKLAFAAALGVIYSTPPRIPVSMAESLTFSLGYDFDTDPASVYATGGPYTESGDRLYFADETNLSEFRGRGGKLMMYHGASDSSVSMNDTLAWYKAMNERMNGQASEFAQLYLVPGMGHCRGGPSTDTFDMLPQLIGWVEQGKTPGSVHASASNPAYFGVAKRTRPLCPYPKQTRYDGSGDINDADNFSCR